MALRIHAIAALCWAVASAAQASTVQYTCKDLGVPAGSPHSFPIRINDDGVVVGFGTTHPTNWTDRDPFVYRAGAMHRLFDVSVPAVASLPGCDESDGDGLSVNDAGLIVGTGGGSGCAVRWEPLPVPPL